MNWNPVGAVAGFAVLIVGAITLLSVTGATAPPTGFVTPPATTTKAPPGPMPIAPLSSELPNLPGVSDEITRVLYWKGNAEAVSVDQLEGVPDDVASVLLEYGAALRIPQAPDSRQ